MFFFIEKFQTQLFQKMMKFSIAKEKPQRYNPKKLKKGEIGL